MYNGFSTIGIIEQVEENHHCGTTEEYGQRHGRLIRLPLLRDRIILQAGTILIHFGEKITESSKERLYLSEEVV
ncbi:MAG TPA: hypothetical protein VIS72_14030 [Anaerolineales bacterium]